MESDWYDYCYQQQQEAENATNGVFFTRYEYDAQRKAGISVYDLFYGGSAARAYRFASEELVAWWEEHPRLTMAEFAYRSGITYKWIVEQARKAPAARDKARRDAEHRHYEYRKTIRW